jgi:hypothetical protein
VATTETAHTTPIADARRALADIDDVVGDDDFVAYFADSEETREAQGTALELLDDAITRLREALAALPAAE